LAGIVADKLRLLWSPEQITGWLKHTYPGDESRQVSHETIYRSLFIQARGALKKELLEHLRRKRGMRRGSDRRPWCCVWRRHGYRVTAAAVQACCTACRSGLKIGVRWRPAAERRAR
jgi:hypothetical protein